MCVGRIERGHCRSPYQAPPLKRPRLVAVYSGPRPAAVATQTFAVVMREASRLKRPECSTRRKSSTRIRELREWKRTKASLLCSEQRTMDGERGNGAQIVEHGRVDPDHGIARHAAVHREILLGECAVQSMRPGLRGSRNGWSGRLEAVRLRTRELRGVELMVSCATALRSRCGFASVWDWHLLGWQAR